MNSPLISIVSPVYKARNIIPELVTQIEKSVQEFTGNFEIILVDDGCPENSWEIIEKIANNNPSVIGIKLSRNFGQHFAIAAGLDQANGDWVVVMDCDLQDRPEDIMLLYRTAVDNNWDIVIAKSNKRNLTFIKEFSSKIYKKVFNYFSNIDLEDGIGNFGIYHRNVIKSIKQMGDQIRVFPILVKWVGFKRTTVDIYRDERKEGKSSYDYWALFKLAFDIGLAFSDKILRICLSAGLLTILSAIIYSVNIFIRYYKGVVTVPGYTSLLITVLMMSGFILTFMGILGLYISKMFQKIKDRPLYIVSKTTFYDN
jgi:dolichol-phosphate mannosyltransferase